MTLKNGFLGGFLILGFVLFLVGFLTGMLAIALVPSRLDPMVEFMIFVLGFLAGAVIIALVLTVVRLSELTGKDAGAVSSSSKA